MMRTVGFYIVNYRYRLGLILIIWDLGPSGEVNHVVDGFNDGDGNNGSHNP